MFSEKPLQNNTMRNWILICWLLVSGSSLSAQNIFPASGNVGIGTTSPANKLTVEGQIESGPLLLKAWSQSPYANSSWLRGMSDVGVFLTNNNITRWAGIKADGSFDVSSGMLFIDGTTGNVGVGTSNPQFKLDVNGNVHHQGKLSIGTTYNGFALNVAGNAYVIGGHTFINEGYGYLSASAVTGMFPSASDIVFRINNIEQMRIDQNGNMGIGVSNPSEKISINGNVRAKKVIVSQTGWPDYVFDSSYSLRSLSEVESFIAKNKHLPDMPSAKEVDEKGISVGDNQALLVKKIEELTLYLLDIHKENLGLKKELIQLKEELIKFRTTMKQ